MHRKKMLHSKFPLFQGSKGWEAMRTAGAEGGNEMHKFLEDVNQRPKFKDKER